MTNGYSVSEKKQLKRVSILATGTRGDIQPYVAIALSLRQSGYSVRILTNNDHKSFVESFDNLVHVNVFGNAEQNMKNPLLMKSQAEGDAVTFFKALSDINQKEAGMHCRRFLEEMQAHRPDLLVCAALTEYYELYASVALGLPTMKIQLNAVSPNPKRAPLGFPTLPFGLHDYLLFNAGQAIGMRSWEHNDTAMESLPGGRRVLPDVDRKRYRDLAVNPTLPVLVCRSPLYQPISNPGIHKNFKFVGAAIIDAENESRHPSSFGGDIFQELTEFLEADPDRKPVYLGWGSIICKSPEHMVILATEALRRSNQRGIILGGWAKLSHSLLQQSTNDANLISYAEKHILFVDKAPHEWLLPQVAAAVHHGGAGTTNASLRSGVPTIITPIFMDQFDNAYLVQQLGVGIGFATQFQRISAEELAEAIEQVIRSNNSNHYRNAAKEISAKLKKETGAPLIVEEIQHFWEDCVSTGAWNQATDGLRKTDGGFDNTKRKLIMIGKVVLSALALHNLLHYLIFK